MEKIKNNKTLYFFVQVIYNTIFAMVLWPLLDMFFRHVIDKKEFVYSVNDHILQPIMYGFFVVIFTNALKKIPDKKKR